MERSEVIRHRLPTPIASLYAGAVNTLDRYEGAKRFLTVFEHTVQYLGLVGLADWTRRPGARLDPEENTLREVIGRPSLGRWVGLVRMIDAALGVGGQPYFGCDLKAKRDDMGEYVEISRRLDLGSGAGKPHLASVMDGLVQFRNAFEHHGRQDDLALHRDALKVVVEKILASIPVLQTWRLAVAERVIMLKRGQADVALRVFQGTSPVVDSRILPQAVGFVTDGTYLLRDDEQIDLHPFILKAGKEVVFLCGLERSKKPMFVCPHTSASPGEVDEADQELRSLLPFLYHAVAGEGLEPMRVLAEAVASDGVVTRSELEFLGRKARDLGLAASEREAADAARRAVAAFAAAARVDPGPQEVVAKLASTEPAPSEPGRSDEADEDRDDPDPTSPHVGLGPMARLLERADASGIRPLFEAMRQGLLSLKARAGGALGLLPKRTQLNLTLKREDGQGRNTLFAISAEPAEGHLVVELWPAHFERADLTRGAELAGLLAFCDAHGHRKTIRHPWKKDADYYRLLLQDEASVEAFLAYIAKAKPVCSLLGT